MDVHFFSNHNICVRKDQLKEIRKSTLALIVCMTSDIQHIQPNAFDRLNVK